MFGKHVKFTFNKVIKGQNILVECFVADHIADQFRKKIESDISNIEKDLYIMRMSNFVVTNKNNIVKHRYELSEVLESVLC